MYPSLVEMKDSLKKLGEYISKKGLPSKFAPYVFAVTSKGRVAEGALEALTILPHTFVKAEDLGTIPVDNK